MKPPEEYLKNKRIVLGKDEKGNEIMLQEDEYVSMMVIQLMEDYARDTRREQRDKKVKCDNCGDMVKMISSGEFCPHCYN